MTRPTPKHPAPELNIPLLDGTQWKLADQQPEHFTLIIFHRGLHCPLCKKYLQQLHELLTDFNERGVSVIALSMDTEKRARLSRQKWELSHLAMGYSLSEDMARSWGLYISAGVKDGEPAVFSEPGLFLVDKKGLVYYASTTSNPWGRPYLASFVKAVDYIIHSGYPARGELI